MHTYNKNFKKKNQSPQALGGVASLNNSNKLSQYFLPERRIFVAKTPFFQSYPRWFPVCKIQPCLWCSGDQLFCSGLEVTEGMFGAWSPVFTFLGPLGYCSKFCQNSLSWQWQGCGEGPVRLLQLQTPAPHFCGCPHHLCCLESAAPIRMLYQILRALSVLWIPCFSR